jgi:hypothetical protein
MSSDSYRRCFLFHFHQLLRRDVLRCCCLLKATGQTFHRCNSARVLTCEEQYRVFVFRIAYEVITPVNGFFQDKKIFAGRVTPWLIGGISQNCGAHLSAHGFGRSGLTWPGTQGNESNPGREQNDPLDSALRGAIMAL